jgi:hypothetical protein
MRVAVVVVVFENYSTMRTKNMMHPTLEGCRGLQWREATETWTLTARFSLPLMTWSVTWWLSVIFVAVAWILPRCRHHPHEMVDGAVVEVNGLVEKE